MELVTPSKRHIKIFKLIFFILKLLKINSTTLINYLIPMNILYFIIMSLIIKENRKRRPTEGVDFDSCLSHSRE